VVADDFDDMLADFRAADLANAPPSHVAPVIADAIPLSVASAQAPKVSVSKATILEAIWAGDLARLRRWHRLGVRYSANMACNATESGSIAVVQCLVRELGADVDVARSDGETPLFIASWNGNLDLVRYLVKILGADVNKESTLGTTALFVAAQNGHLEVVRCLLKSLGADVNQTASDRGTTLVMITAEHGHLAVVQLLARRAAVVPILTKHVKIEQQP
jgi:predicted LPLAT superfamily acyltransferase